MVGLCPFRQRGIWTLDSVDFATAWTFSVEMSVSSCSASGATGPDHYSVFLLFHFPFEENHQIKITANPENVDLRLSKRPPPRLGRLAVACSLLVDPGRRPCAIFLTSHSSATPHQWLNLFSTRHECFTSDVGLTRTRLVSCILLTSLMTRSAPAPRHLIFCCYGYPDRLPLNGRSYEEEEAYRLEKERAL